MPTFPLNTDGIDPAGKNVTIRNVKITNFDDAVAVKPIHAGDSFSDCSEDMLIENVTVYYGVGMTIGTVKPNKDYNCIRNITFRDIEFHHPCKAVYIKTNPGDVGSGEISNILYENISIKNPIWWNVYIGPQ
mmetsp:Transcript_9646/g.6914  ORF Transcript_9646/g.6914 Transcript_9646/m.6914 type:complete len:132 (-) Transcript_9646:485-880(-)